MRYSRDRKAETHARIVQSAAREFRAHGLKGIGISDLMSRIGLTQGGFYAHFRNRDALVAEATEEAAKQSLEMLVQAATQAPGREVQAMVDCYLNAAHRDHPAQGCLLPAIAADVARQPKAIRRVFTASMKGNLAQLAQWMPAREPGEKARQAVHFISAMAGAVMISRAVEDAAAASWILESVRAQLLATFGFRAA